MNSPKCYRPLNVERPNEPELYLNIQFAPCSKENPSRLQKPTRYGEIIAACSEIYTKHINTTECQMKTLKVR